MDPITAQEMPEKIMRDIQRTARANNPIQTNTAQECKARGRTRRTPEERLQALQARAEMLEAALKQKRRKAETREKIVLGGWVRALCRNDADRVRIMDFLGRYAASRRVDVPQTLRPAVESAMKKAAAAKTEKTTTERKQQ